MGIWQYELISEMLENLRFLRHNGRMTDEKQLISEIHSLPESLKAEVAKFVEKLKGTAAPISATQRRKAGSARGAYVIAPDFDEPLEDFKEYM